ncbi:MAG: lysophospholipid acyltransferase family protein [Methylococcaceae bacterium]
MKSKIRLLYKLFLIVFLFISGLIITAGVFPLINFFCSGGSAKTKCDLIKMRWLRWFGVIINLRSVKHGDLPDQTAMLVSNHISWLDIIVIGQYLPAYFVAKSDILDWPVIGYLARQGGTIFIRRGDKKHIVATAEKMVWMLKQNSHVIVFPEGTTTKGDNVLHFHASLFQPVLLTRSVIQPVVIKYQGAANGQAPFIGDDAFIPHLINLLSLEEIEVSVSFLPAMNNLGENRHTVSHEARRVILEQIFSDIETSDCAVNFGLNRCSG